MIHNLFTRTWFVYSAVGIAMKTQSEFSIKQSNYEKSQFKSSVLFGMKQTHSYKSRSQQCKYKKRKILNLYGARNNKNNNSNGTSLERDEEREFQIRSSLV